MTQQKRAPARPLVTSPPVAGATGAENGAPPIRNYLLRLLTPRARDVLLPDMELLQLGSGSILFEPGAAIEHVYFPETCVASMVRRMIDGAGIEVGTIGYEGVVGVSVLMGATTMPTQCLIQIPGTARRISVAALVAALERPALKATDGRSMAAVMQLYSQALFEQVAQSAACNRMHSLEQRCARWLLMTHDRAVGDELALTQEFLSYMLGVRRAGVTEAAGVLQRAELINYRHGRIRIRDRKGLEAVACECYSVGVLSYEELLGSPAEII